MKAFGIRSRILLTVLGPAILVAVLVTGLLVVGQMRQAEAEHAFTQAEQIFKSLNNQLGLESVTTVRRELYSS